MKNVYRLVSLLLIVYVFLPNKSFPIPPSDFLQSQEPADTENPLRRAYFTNLTREEVMIYYQRQFLKNDFLDIKVPTYRLNYPPEEAASIIRDQTRSTFLEEVVHPFRESLFVNGFEPNDPKDAIYIEGQNWRQKIIVKLIPSSTLLRTSVTIGSILLLWIILNQWGNVVSNISNKK